MPPATCGRGPPNLTRTVFLPLLWLYVETRALKLRGVKRVILLPLQIIVVKIETNV